MKVGFIGTGSMGGLLVGAFVKSGALRPEDITVSSRTPSKPAELARLYPGLRAASSNAEAVQGAELLFLCVKPSDYPTVIAEIASGLDPGQIVVSITSPVKLARLEQLLPCKIAKVIPSVVNAAGAGASLFMWGTRLEQEDRDRLLTLFGAVSRPVEIREEQVRAAADLSSCGPAFFAYLLEQFTEAAVRESGLDRQTADVLSAEMLHGTARLLLEQGYSTRELQARVSVPGGITAAALEALKTAAADAFPKVLRVTHQKFAEDLEKVERALFPSSGPVLLDTPAEENEKGGSP